MKYVLVLLTMVACVAAQAQQTPSRAQVFKDAQQAHVAPGNPGMPGMGPFPVRQCDDKELFSRVCGEGGVLTPLLHDSTGVIGTFVDLQNSQKARVEYSKELGKITPEGWQRFERAFDVVVGEYKELASTLPMPYRQVMLNQLASYRRISKEETQKMLDSVMLKIVMNPAKVVNAFYQPGTRSVYFFPAFDNEPRISMAAFTTVLAHEMGHHMDPELVAHIPGQAGMTRFSRADLVSPAAYNCWINSFGTFKPTAEDWADWMASMVMDRLIVKFQLPMQKLRYAQNSVKLFCLAGGSSKKSAGDPHAAPRDRVLWILRQPNLRQSVDCTPTVVENQTVMPVCNLQGRIH